VYGITGTLAVPLTVAVFSGLGWLMRRNSYPVAATVIGLLLGRMVEGELVRTIQISNGHPLSYLMERPIALVLFVIMLLVLVGAPALKAVRQRKATRTDT
jgi:putative tricarboxylic transport membrane protein